MKSYTKEQTIQSVQDFIKSNNIAITLEEIQTIVYNATSHNALFELWMGLCDKAWLELDQASIDLISNCWNNFPHKDLWGKSPSEMARR